MAELVVVFIDDLSATENPWGPQRTTSNTATNSRGTGWDCLIHCYISSRFNKVQYTTIGQRFLTWQWVRATCMYCKPWSDLGGGGGAEKGCSPPFFSCIFFNFLKWTIFGVLLCNCHSNVFGLWIWSNFALSRHSFGRFRIHPCNHWIPCMVQCLLRWWKICLFSKFVCLHQINLPHLHPLSNLFCFFPLR